MKYIVKFNSEFNAPAFETNSRDSKKFVREFGVETVIIYNKSGKVISAARRDRETNKIYNVFLGQLINK